jgi:hypothetical protein
LCLALDRSALPDAAAAAAAALHELLLLLRLRRV